jgi:hypothetical protein
MSLHRVCCCGEGNCCKCHPVYGGATSWTVTWSGSVAISPPDCACIASTAPTLPSVSEAALVGSYSITSVSYVFDWTNPFDPLTCTVKAVTGSVNFVQSAQVDYETYSVDSSGNCTFNAGPFPNGGRMRVTVVVLPPDCNVPRTNWTVTVAASGIVTWTFTGSTSCTSPGPFTLTNTQVTEANGSCFLHNAGVAAFVNYSAGTVTIT